MMRLYTAIQLSAILIAKGYSLSLSTLLRCRKSLGWTFRGSAYCQMIREANKAVRLEWVTRYLEGPSSHMAHDNSNVPCV